MTLDTIYENWERDASLIEHHIEALQKELSTIDIKYLALIDAIKQSEGT